MRSLRARRADHGDVPVGCCARIWYYVVNSTGEWTHGSISKCACIVSSKVSTTGGEKLVQNDMRRVRNELLMSIVVQDIQIRC